MSDTQVLLSILKKSREEVTKRGTLLASKNSLERLMTTDQVTLFDNSAKNCAKYDSCQCENWHKISQWKTGLITYSSVFAIFVNLVKLLCVYIWVESRRKLSFVRDFRWHNLGIGFSYQKRVDKKTFFCHKPHGTFWLSDQ